MKYAFLSAVISLLWSLALSCEATNGRVDYDLDDDGLIEINDLADLNDIRNSLDGKKLYGVSTGCPAAGCNGFELITDLNFDTNGDGKLDASDSYWNAGQGWVPIGTDRFAPYTAIFDGNGHLIRNLMINRPLRNNLGLFGYTENASLRNLGLNGRLLSITGYSYVGGLVGYADKTNISQSFVSGTIVSTNTNYSYAGGLVGSTSDGSVIASFTSGSVQSAGDSAGGLIGYASFTHLESVFSSASVKGLGYVGGLMGTGIGVTINAAYGVGNVTCPVCGGGLSGLEGTFSSSYWASDTSGQLRNQGKGAVVATLAQLKCPITADNTTCLSGQILYAGWGELKDAKGNAYWDFGSNTQLPGLRLNGIVYRDDDGDGYLDTDDKWPSNFAASLDSDKDGAPDSWTLGCDSSCQADSGLVLDQFPLNAAASLDLDLDGKPDSWNANCNSACQSSSGLVLDTKPNDADNDGILDAADTDTNNDGVSDADVNHNGLIEISTLAQLDAVRYNLTGTGRKLTAAGTIDSSGCPLGIVNGVAQRICFGYELTQDLDFDINGDGKLNASDSYWNEGLGWVAIGSGGAPFTATFDGKGHTIRNLMINRPNESRQGLFNGTQNAILRNLGMNGRLMSIRGYENVGGLVGSAGNTNISQSFVSGTIVSFNTIYSYTGGLVGSMYGGSVIASFSSGSVQGAGFYVGGLLGYASDRATLESVFSIASTNGYSYVGGLVGSGAGASVKAAYAAGNVTSNGTTGGLSGDSGDFTISYWASDASGQVRDGGTGSLAATLAQLRCPTASDNTVCVSGKTLYAGWSELKDAKGNAYWDFGNSSQLPALVFNGVNMRDTDGDGIFDREDSDDDNDGILDAQDKFASNIAASVDSDGDGSPDEWNGNCDSRCQAISGLTLDAFPKNKAAAVDTDGDGSPDSWNAGCDTICQANSGLKLDALPNTNAASVDSDTDGSPDSWNTSCDSVCQNSSGLALDAYPNNKAASIDSDGDGNPDAWNSSCDSTCQINSGLKLDALPNSKAASVDTDGDGSPDSWNANCNTTCQASSGLKLDVFPNNKAASVDTDSDGSPDSWNTNCDTNCQANSGLTLDAFSTNKAASIDSDGDGSPNSWNLGCDTTCQTNSGLKLDAFPTNKAASIDSDGDGVPDSWNASCNASCQIASLLVIDQLPNNKAASVDTDGDGSPDTWNLSCNTSCKTASGLTLDAFPNNKAATLDADGDGRPDAWNASCNAACQTSSGLTLDTLLNDKDNDGVPDSSDPDNTRDNGKPTIVAVPEDINIAATGATTLVTLLKADVSAFDAVDSQLALEVSNGSQLLTIDANNQVALPSGALKLRWVAIDKAGNRSDAVEQLVNIYPQVQFTKTQDKVGEKTTAKLALSFSGAVPVYPVKLTFSWVNSESTAVTADVNTTVETGIDLSKLSLTLTNAEELAKAALSIPVLEDALVENDETLVFEITAASAGKDQPFSLPIVDAGKRTVLTITELNLAPTAVLSMTQAGKVTSLIDPKGGVVDVTSVVTDLNGKDTHSFVWDTTGLPVSGLDKATYSFDPLKMANGSYNLSLTVTDNGLPPLSSEKVTLKFEVKGQSSSSSSSSSKSSSSNSSNSSAGSNSSSSVGTGTSPETGGGSGGGGGSIDFLLLFVLCSLGFRFRVAKH